jgi:hypothetical protein
METTYLCYQEKQTNHETQVTNKAKRFNSRFLSKKSKWSMVRC